MKKRFENRPHSLHDPLPTRRGSLPMRLGALTLASSMLWSLCLAGAARAATYKAPQPVGHTRSLTPAEMRAITGAQGIGPMHALSTAESSGSTYAWQPTFGGTNVGNGNKTTTLPLIRWAARGGMPVALTLTHNSEGSHNGELGHKWTLSYNVYLTSMSSNPVVHWGDDLAETYTAGGSSYAAPTGVHSALVENVDSTFTLTKTDQTAYHFNTSGYCDSITDENGNTVTVNHNTDGTVSSVVDPNSRTLTLAYDSSHRIHTVTDPLSRVWTLDYNSSSELTEVDWPALSGTTYSVYYGYNTDHDITSVTDLRGHSRSLTYNSDDSLATEADNAGNTTSYTYASSGTTVTDPNSHSTVYAFDGSGRGTEVTDAASDSEYTTYDSANNKTQVEDKRGKYWNYTYNTAGDLLTAEDPNSHTTTLTYNSHHKPLTVTMPGGESVVLSYDSDDNQTGEIEKDASGTTLATTTYTIGSYGLLSAKEDADSETTYYGYDTDGDLSSVTTPEGNETQWGHDGLGVVTSRIDAMSRETDYTLDAWERVTTNTYPDTSTYTYTYDADGNLTQFVDATGTTSRVYDTDNRMTSESKGGATVVSHTYDATGKLGLLSTTTDSNSRTITYAYTNRNQLYTVAETAGTTTYTYDANGNETAITNGNGTTVTNVYDNADRLTSVINKASSGTTLSSFAYAYNSDNLRTSSTEASGDVVSYGYDGQLHLTSESRTGTYAYTNSYTVDGVGNRTQETIGGTTRYFDYDDDSDVRDVDPVYYDYDNDGEQVHRSCIGPAGDLKYVDMGYDYDGNLTSADGYDVDSGGHYTSVYSTSFAYDALGRQVQASRSATGTTTAYQYDGDAVLLEKQGSTVTASYTYGNALLRKDGETPMFDGLGSERTVTNSSGASSASLTTDAFGNAVTSSGSSASVYQFGATSGYRTEGDANLYLDNGLMKVGSRYYDPEVGRFTSRDTDLSQSAYVYCEGNPVNYLDPSGHLPEWLNTIITGLGLATAGGILIGGTILAGTGFGALLGPIGVGLAVGLVFIGIASVIVGVVVTIVGVFQGLNALGEAIADQWCGPPESW